MKHESQYPTTFYRVSLKAVIRNKSGEVLVCKEYDSEHFSLPGGGWDHGESEMECLARELNEEVGYVGKLTAKPISTAVWWLESRQAWLLWIVYEVTTENVDFSLTEMCHDVAFVDPKTFVKSEGQTEHWMAENL